MSFFDFWAPVAPPLFFLLGIVALTLLGDWLGRLNDRANNKHYADWLAKNPGSNYAKYLKDIHK